MQRKIALFLLANSLCIAANQITLARKLTDTSHVFANNVLPKEVIEKSKTVFNSDENSAYLEDVTNALKNENWTAEEMPCLNRTLVVIKSLRNFTLWSVWEWDSMSSAPLGLLYGSQYHLGNFDECLNTPWRDSHTELRTRYCLADIELLRTDGQRKSQWNRNDPYQSAPNLIQSKSELNREIKKLTWGMCVPAECQPRSVQKLTKVMLSHTHLSMAGLSAQISVDDTCQDVYENKRYNGLFYVFIGLFIFLTSITIICTLFNNKPNKHKGVGSHIIRAFDIRSNMSNMLKSSDELHVLYGIKFMSMCVVVIGHQIGMFSSGPVSNGDRLDEGIKSFVGLLLLHNDLVVDTFFMLSGFLTATIIAKMKNLPNPLIIIFKRYVRLALPFALATFYMVAIFPYTGTGPLWNRAAMAEAGFCRQNWWVNLLMINNYVGTDRSCLITSWYIPCDFHFFVVTLFLFVVYRQSPTLGKLLGAAIIVASVVLPGVSTYINEFPPILTFNIEFITRPRSNKQFIELYIKSHMRYSTYIIGFIAGYIYVRSSFIDRLKRLSQTWLTTIAYASTVCIFGCMYLGSTLFLHQSDALVSAVYAALNRPFWVVGLSLMVMCCSIGHVPVINVILGWYPWVPLSRLSYGVYLIHPMFIARNVFVARNLQSLDGFILATLWAGVLVWSHVAALFMWLVAEAPINNLVTLMLKQGYKSDKTEEENTKEKSRSHENGAYLDDNFPNTIPTIQVISSKC